MRQALWPDSTAEEVDGLIRGEPSHIHVLIADSEMGICGFAEVGTRRYAEGCETSPVAYLEGIWVDEPARRIQVGRALVTAAESWARSQGLSELASDCDTQNEISRLFHVGSGFEEVERIICFRKSLDPGPTRQTAQD